MADPQLVLNLARRQITLAEAREAEDDILQELRYPQQRFEFCLSLLRSEDYLLDLVAFHLNVDRQKCTLASVQDWCHGSFNFIVPVNVNSGGRNRVIIRIPLPYKVGESRYPGNIDEKLRCEAATYIHIQEHCPDVPIPKLWGFGFTDGSHFTALENTSLLCRLRRFVSNNVRAVFRYPLPASFVRIHSPKLLKKGYLIMDFVEQGKMLSETWSSFRQDQRRRQNLFRDLSRIMLSLGKMPQTQIGSFTIDCRGFLSLSNRPLTVSLHQLENMGIPSGIDRQTTYSTTESYVLDLISYHSNRLIHQPNSINDITDGRKQIAAIALMRSILLDFVISRRGPFTFMLTDLHQSNIFVDDDWHITSLIDLEWACSLPTEMQQPPYWITDQAVDHLTGDNLEEFNRVRSEFMRVYQQEEEYLTKEGSTQAQFMQRSWQGGGFWYFIALETTKGFYNLFLQHIQPLFSSRDLPFMEVSPFWHQDTEEILQSKLDDREKYLRNLDEAAIAQWDDTKIKNNDEDMQPTNVFSSRIDSDSVPYVFPYVSLPSVVLRLLS